MEAKELPDLSVVHDRQCANMIRARGDIAVTLCERSSTMNIYAVSDLTLIASVNFEFYA